MNWRERQELRPVASLIGADLPPNVGSRMRGWKPPVAARILGADRASR